METAQTLKPRSKLFPLALFQSGTFPYAYLILASVERIAELIWPSLDATAIVLFPGLVGTEILLRFWPNLFATGSNPVKDWVLRGLLIVGFLASLQHILDPGRMSVRSHAIFIGLGGLVMLAMVVVVLVTTISYGPKSRTTVVMAWLSGIVGFISMVALAYYFANHQ